MIQENNPNRRMVMVRNPNFHGEQYPQEGEASDEKESLLTRSGDELPFIDKAIFILEKESIPRWNKFLQGYYDTSGISSDSFDQAIQISEAGHAELSDSMKAQEIRLKTLVQPSVFYMGFNMLDDVVGGNSVRAKKLRQAISYLTSFPCLPTAQQWQLHHH